MHPHEALPLLRTGRAPAGLRVEGDLGLAESRVALTFPEGLEVAGDLDLRKCPWLETLPRGLQIRGTLDLGFCERLRDLPQGLEVSGDLNLAGCELESLPADVRVAGSLVLYLAKVRSLPDGLEVGGHLDLTRCDHLTRLPDDLRVGGRLLLCGCSKLVGLPSDMSLGSRLLLPREAGGIPLSDVTKAGIGASRVANWSRLGYATERTANLVLDCPHCTSLAELPRNLRIDGSVSFTACSSLSSLPPGLQVGGSLILLGCTDLRELPDGLTVPGDLDLALCTGISALPRDLSVAGALNLDHPMARPPGLMFGELALRGVRVPEDLAFARQRITVEQIDREENVEVRRLMIEAYGLRRYLEECDARLVDAVDESSLVGLQGARLYRRESPGDEPFVFVKLVNSTSGPDGEPVVHTLRVPPDIKTCRQAVAWSFGLAEWEYAPERES